MEPTELRIQTAIHVSKSEKENLPLKHENSSVIERTKMTQQHGGVGMLATLLRPERTPHIVCGGNADVQMGSSQIFSNGEVVRHAAQASTQMGKDAGERYHGPQMGSGRQI